MLSFQILYLQCLFSMARRGDRSSLHKATGTLFSAQELQSVTLVAFDDHLMSDVRVSSWRQSPCMSSAISPMECSQRLLADSIRTWYEAELSTLEYWTTCTGSFENDHLQPSRYNSADSLPY
jgi:hypothetical protein